MLLAAGAGSRFRTGEGAGHKLLAPFRERTVVWWSVANALAAGLDATWVVEGAVGLSGHVPEGSVLLSNPDWSSGQASSLGRAIREARLRGAEAVVVGLGDQPLIPPSAWRAVAGADAEVAVATYDGARRNPVKLSAGVWKLLPSTGDEGARVLMRNRPELIEEVPCTGHPVDIDTREDLDRWS